MIKFSKYFFKFILCFFVFVFIWAICAFIYNDFNYLYAIENRPFIVIQIIVSVFYCFVVIIHTDHLF